MHVKTNKPLRADCCYTVLKLVDRCFVTGKISQITIVAKGFGVGYPPEKHLEELKFYSVVFIVTPFSEGLYICLLTLILYIFVINDSVPDGAQLMCNTGSCPWS